MALFTLVTEYCGGTYVAQATFKSLDELLSKIDDAIGWDELLALGVIKGAKNARRRFVEEMLEAGVVPIDGTRNVWCGSAILGRSLVIINIIKTAR